jgi:hypothetical protein
MLEIFKQQKSFLTRAKEKSSFKYIIDFDSNGAFIDVCDNKLKPLRGVDYRVYNGLDREILQLIDECREDDFFQISWERESEEIYLSSHPRLLELLRLSDKVFTAKDESISFESGVFQVGLEIIREENQFLVSPVVEGSSSFRFLTESYTLLDNRVLQIHSIGDNFEQLKTFHTVIEEKKLEEFLTILVTHFENIDIIYDGYSVEKREETKQITPAVIFEKITVDNELVLRTSATVGQLSPEFFNDFNITKIVLVNDLTKIISIYECDFSDVFEMYGTIFKNLNSLKRGKKELDFSEEDGLFIINQELAGKFILNHLHSIITKCELFGSEKLKAYKYNTSIPTLVVNFKDKIDFLDRSDVSVNIGEEQFDVFDLINLYRKHAYIPLKSGEKSIVDKAYMAKLERIFKKDGKEKVKVSFFDLPEVEELIAQKEQKVFNDSREFYQGFNKLKKETSTTRGGSTTRLSKAWCQVAKVSL